MIESDRVRWRGLTIDNHFPDAPFVTFSKFSADEEVTRLVAAGVDSVHVWMKCHWGYHYYDTKVGLKHPGLDFDMARELLWRVQAAGIEAIAYTCFWFETRTARDHPVERELTTEADSGGAAIAVPPVLIHSIVVLAILDSSNARGITS